MHVHMHVQAMRLISCIVNLPSSVSEMSKLASDDWPLSQALYSQNTGETTNITQYMYVPCRTGDYLDSSIAGRSNFNRGHIIRVLTRTHSNLHKVQRYTNTLLHKYKGKLLSGDHQVVSSP